MTKQHIPTISLSGSPSELGEQHGRIMKRQIKELARVRKDLLVESVSDYNSVKTVAEKCWQTVCNTSQKLGEELDATAYAADITGWELIIAGAYTDVASLLQINREDCSECTVGIVKPCIFGTWDSHYEAGRGALILKRIQDDGLSTISLTTAGWPVQFGINSFGLGFGTTNLTPKTSNDTGLPYIAALALISTVKNAEMATSLLKEQVFMSGHSYILVDNNNAIILETTPEKIHQIDILDYYCQTNHYTSSIDDNSEYEFLSGSIVRLNKVNDSVQSFVNPSTFLKWLIRSPDVLRKPDESSNMASCAAYVVDAKEKILWYVNLDSNPIDMDCIAL